LGKTGASVELDTPNKVLGDEIQDIFQRASRNSMIFYRALPKLLRQLNATIIGITIDGEEESLSITNSTPTKDPIWELLLPLHDKLSIAIAKLVFVDDDDMGN